jgi:hypothetical protein
MPTLSGIYQQLSNGTPASINSGFTEPNAAPTAGTGRTLLEIKGLLPTMDDANGAQPGQVLAGKTYWGLNNGNWGPQTGTMPVMSTVTSTLTPTQGTLPTAIPDGCYTNSSIAGSSKLLPQYIISGVTIYGVAGTLQSPATCTSTTNAWNSCVANYVFNHCTAICQGRVDPPPPQPTCVQSCSAGMRSYPENLKEAACNTSSPKLGC